MWATVKDAILSPQYKTPLILFGPLKLLYDFRQPILYNLQLNNEIFETFGTLVFPLGMFFQQRGISEGMLFLDLVNYYLIEILFTLLPHAVYIAYNMYGDYD